MISSGGRRALLGSALEDKRQDIAKFLSAELKQVSPDFLDRSWVTGFEVAALTLLDALAQQFAVTEPSPPPVPMEKMFDAWGLPSLQEMTERFIHECFLAGIGDIVEEALVQTRKEGDTRLANARSMQPKEPDFEEMQVAEFLDSSYAELQQAVDSISSGVLGVSERAGVCWARQRCAKAIRKATELGGRKVCANQRRPDVRGERS
jgi:hypothetical protein